ncbi:MAG: hypothetical protein NVSMB5_02210 [Candidatus Velthaea sp.]
MFGERGRVFGERCRVFGERRLNAIESFAHEGPCRNEFGHDGLDARTEIGPDACGFQTQFVPKPADLSKNVRERDSFLHNRPFTRCHNGG